MLKRNCWNVVDEFCTCFFFSLFLWFYCNGNKKIIVHLLMSRVPVFFSLPVFNELCIWLILSSISLLLFCCDGNANKSCLHVNDLRTWHIVLFTCFNKLLCTCFSFLTFSYCFIVMEMLKGIVCLFIIAVVL